MKDITFVTECTVIAIGVCLVILIILNIIL